MIGRSTSWSATTEGCIVRFMFRLEGMSEDEISRQKCEALEACRFTRDLVVDTHDCFNTRLSFMPNGAEMEFVVHCELVAALKDGPMHRRAIADIRSVASRAQEKVRWLESERKAG
jgi:hypothetical protein